MRSVALKEERGGVGGSALDRPRARKRREVDRGDTVALWRGRGTSLQGAGMWYKGVVLRLLICLAAEVHVVP